MKKTVTFDEPMEAIQFLADSFYQLQLQVQSLEEQVFAQNCIIDLLQKGGTDCLESNEYWIDLLERYANELRDFGLNAGEAEYAERVATLIEKFGVVPPKERLNLKVVKGGKSEE
ncbi:hypothetical protein [Sulfitobacter sp. 1A13679]|uniref:hypothetical protein n=1 Tax=Sulfitobacter sp. 1A13679 TaxID=3368597 RepID=UPI003746872F